MLLTGPGFNDISIYSSTWLTNNSASLLKIHSSPILKMLYFVKSMKFSDLFSEDISFAEYVMLRLITEIETETENMDVWVSDIVKRVNITPQAVSKFIHHSIRKGYIEQFENTSDRRSIGVKMTNRGRAVLSKTEEELNFVYNNVINEFSDEERTTMHRLMIKLQKVVQKNYLENKKK
jgi:DNA-binding MarR family transcriptional regulator